MNLLPDAELKKRVFRMNFTFHPTQQKVRHHPARHKIVRCGRKWGKTTLAERTALDWMGPPGKVIWDIAPTYKQAKLISWTKFKEIIPQEAFGKKPNDSDLTITLKNGSQLFLMGSDEPDSLRGPEPDGVIFEEAALQKPEVWPNIIRPNLIPKKAPAMFIYTPKGYNWVYDLEQEAKVLISRHDPEWGIFHYTIFDNPHLDKAEIAKARRDCDSEAVWRQEYLAEYESSVGRVFSAFSGDVGGHHVKKVVVPSGVFDSYRSVDWGMRDNTACLWAYVAGGRLFIYREYLANNLSAPAQAKIIKEQTTRYERVQRTAISHDAAKEDPAMKGLTVLWHFRQAGISPLQPSSRDKKHSRAMINQLLQENRLVMDAEKCPKLRKQLMAYEWKDTAMEKPDESADDDAVDALHYLVEMLQFELFMDRKRDDVMSQDQIYAEIAKERLESWQHPTATVPFLFSQDRDLGSQMEDSPAGYL